MITIARTLPLIAISICFNATAIDLKGIEPGQTLDAANSAHPGFAGHCQFKPTDSGTIICMYSPPPKSSTYRKHIESLDTLAGQPVRYFAAKLRAKSGAKDL